MKQHNLGCHCLFATSSGHTHSHAHTHTHTHTPTLTHAQTGLTLPLITTTSGEKLGKSAGNAVWLSPHRTSSYSLYQSLVRTTDQDVGRLLGYFTFLPVEEVQEVIKEHEVMKV